MLKDMAIGLSLANLCFLRVWSEILTYTGAYTYWMKVPPTPAELSAAIFDVILLGCFLGLGVHFLRARFGEAAMKWVRRLFLVSLVIPINAIRAVVSQAVPDWDFLRSGMLLVLGSKGTMVLLLGIAVTGFTAILLWDRPLSRGVCAVLLMLSPFVPVVMLQAAWAAVKYDASAFRDEPPVPLLPVKPDARRVMWIIFDEMDQRLTFIDRDPSLQLPEVDRFRSEALYAAHAQPPGPETPVSMPGYVVGRMVRQSYPSSANRLWLSYTGEGFVPWDQQPNIFQKVRQAGFNSAIVGWYHAYCRVIGKDVSSCQWWPLAMQYNSFGGAAASERTLETVGAVMPNVARSVVETNLFSPFGQSLPTLAHIRTYQAMLARAEQVVVDRHFQFALIHLPVPHAPHTYNRQTGEFSRKNSPVSAYLDSLALVDRTLGELRRKMEDAGVWESTTVLVSSDHSYRVSEVLDGKWDSRIPFLLKLAGRSGGQTLDQEFNTIISGELLLAILEGEVQTAQEAANWIKDHSELKS
jgi:hypothetical protein